MTRTLQEVVNIIVGSNEGVPQEDIDVREIMTILSKYAEPEAVQEIAKRHTGEAPEAKFASSQRVTVKAGSRLLRYPNSTLFTQQLAKARQVEISHSWWTNLKDNLYVVDGEDDYFGLIYAFNFVLADGSVEPIMYMACEPCFE